LYLSLIQGTIASDQGFALYIEMDFDFER